MLETFGSQVAYGPARMSSARITEVIARVASLALCALGLACEARAPAPAVREPAPSEPAAPEVKAIPDPPALSAGDALGCVLRRFDPSTKSWTDTKLAFDAGERTLGAMRFDAAGRLVSFGEQGPGNLETYAYDEHGNLRELTSLIDGRFREGTRWDNRYEGEPPRLVAQAIGVLAKADGESEVHTRVTYRYDGEGHVVEERTEAPRGSWQRTFRWRGDRIVEVRTAREQRTGSSPVPYDEAQRFEYGPSGRLTAYESDGEMLGEGGLADGKADQRTTLHYDAAGRLARIERDGQGGDVAPEPPDGEVDAVTLLTPACAQAIELRPHMFDVPSIHLPHGLKPPAP